MVEIATRTNSRKYLVKGWLLKGQIALADRQSGEAEKWLSQALTMAERIGNPTLCWKTHLAVAVGRELVRLKGDGRTYHLIARLSDDWNSPAYQAPFSRLDGVSPCRYSKAVHRHTQA